MRWTLARAGRYSQFIFWLRRKTRTVAVRGVYLSIQVAILKILASHGNGRATLSSLNRDIAILTASGTEWSARIRRLAARVPAIDIFGAGHVRRGDEGWEITAEGRDFLAMLEAVTQDNSPQEMEPGPDGAAEPLTRGDLIVVGHRFRNRVHRPGAPLRHARGIAGTAGIRHGENSSS